MTQTFQTIDLGGVNCYLVKTEAGFILIDTGFATKQASLEKELERAGCQPGNLPLVILTHGDSDHADNAAFLQKQFGARIGMHADEAGMVEQGNMSWNRKARPDKISPVFRMMMGVMSFFVRERKFETFTPDIFLDENQSLDEYDFEARVYRLPGHSKGSLGILTAAGDLFCGDLLYNLWGKPKCLYIDDSAAFQASLKKLKQLNVKNIYPGHGKPFASELVL
jgi:hydroxyacylglutathione hydrolase